MNITKNIIRVMIFTLGILTTLKLIYSDFQLPGNFYLIPLTYSVLIIVFPSFTNYMFNYIGIFALNVTMFLRYILSPLLISINGIQIIRGIYPIEQSYEIAINLMLYELILLFILFQIFHKRFYKYGLSNEIEIKQKKNVTAILYLVLCIIIVIIYPQVLSRYTFILFASELKSKDLGGDILSSIPLLVQLGILVVTILLLHNIYLKYIRRKKLIYVVFATMVVLFTSSFIIGTSRFSIVLPLITGLYIIYHLFFKHRKLVLMISGFSILFIILLSSTLKATTISQNTSTLIELFNELSSNLQLYFAGISNVAIAVQTESIYTKFNIDSIISDITRSVILINTLFTSNSSALINFNITFYNGGLARDQILPMIGQGYLYFGFWLAPVFSIISLFLVMYFDSKVIQSKYLSYKFIYVYISLKCGLFLMTNINNLLAFYTNYFLILFIIFYINDKFVKEKVGALYEYQ